MAGFTITRQHGFDPQTISTNKLAEWSNKLWILALAIGVALWTVAGFYRFIGVLAFGWLLANEAHPLAAILIGVSIPVIASTQNWWAIIDPPKGGLKATENLIAGTDGRTWLSQAWADIRLTWNAGRAWVDDVWTTSSQARVLSRDWANAADAVGLTDGQQVPELEGIRRTENGFAAEIACGRVGVASDDLFGKANTLAASIESVREVIVAAGPTPGIAQLEFVWGDAIDDPFGLDRLPTAPPGRLCAGLMSPNGQPLTVAMLKINLHGRRARVGEVERGGSAARLADAERRPAPIVPRGFAGWGGAR